MFKSIVVISQALTSVLNQSINFNFHRQKHASMKKLSVSQDIDFFISLLPFQIISPSLENLHNPPPLPHTRAACINTNHTHDHKCSCKHRRWPECPRAMSPLINVFTDGYHNRLWENIIWTHFTSSRRSAMLRGFVRVGEGPCMRACMCLWFVGYIVSWFHSH